MSAIQQNLPIEDETVDVAGAREAVLEGRDRHDLLGARHLSRARPLPPEPVSLSHGKTQGRNFFEGLADGKTTANHGLGMGTR
jgi:hypothetical protein